MSMVNQHYYLEANKPPLGESVGWVKERAQLEGGISQLKSEALRTCGLAEGDVKYQITKKEFIDELPDYIIRE